MKKGPRKPSPLGRGVNFFCVCIPVTLDPDGGTDWQQGRSPLRCLLNASSQTPSNLDRLHQLSELLHPTGVSAGGGSEWGHAGKR
jgi:hypothetical protein